MDPKSQWDYYKVIQKLPAHVSKEAHPLPTILKGTKVKSKNYKGNKKGEKMIKKKQKYFRPREIKRGGIWAYLDPWVGDLIYKAATPRWFLLCWWWCWWLENLMKLEPPQLVSWLMPPKASLFSHLASSAADDTPSCRKHYHPCK